MEYLLNSIKYSLYVHDKVFWLKELSTTVQSAAVFFLLRWCLRRNYEEGFIYLMTFVCFIGIFILPVGYWSDNDIFKFIIPGCLLLQLNHNSRNNNFLLVLVLFLYFFSSYEFYRGFHKVLQSIASHFFIVICVVIAQKINFFATIFISIVIGILVNYIGYYGPSGTNDFLVNTGIISLAIKGIAVYTKSENFENFLITFWIVLLFFAYFGSWIFYFVGPKFPFCY
ncbi:MAG: hypothetical protein MRJ65_14970 [Candidatus Brocadiaceae bacterium]|nr:hypothetical protein [Candidatus Brocadiaceae bacterium]